MFLNILLEVLLVLVEESVPKKVVDVATEEVLLHIVEPVELSLQPASELCGQVSYLKEKPTSNLNQRFSYKMVAEISIVETPEEAFILPTFPILSRRVV